MCFCCRASELQNHVLFHSLVADGEVEGGKILFRKPELKREAKGLSASSKKKPKLDTAHPEGEKKPGKSKSKKSSKQKSPSLLSFNEDEEDGEFD